MTSKDLHIADVRRALLALTSGPETRPAAPESEGEPPTLPAQSAGHDHRQSDPP
jgi:hypothetical protein